ncbi:hypothetical protein SAMN05421866_1972 [Chryseobacterium oranimense]|jgi:hypothetical protein|uniref:Uncharacterized protein n=1 Tax=Chryseobacterium oranimense TaxID=421058 RepID=A0A1M5PWS6_9FLAO|nr:hypothetical protein [Chryseobacterium oranimense]CEJ67986.1 hypothetical protein BN1195_00268 [Chryseobacterium oranimense G311]SHH05713.1 hypothetical protein SAMN05421866_1972 [Chryseobacterium oranimense]
MKLKLITNITVILILIVFFSGFYFLIKTHPNHFNDTVNSRIKKLYRDYDNHGQGTVLTAENKKISVKDIIYYKLKIGDSLIKQKKSLSLKVIRKDSVFYFELL